MEKTRFRDMERTLKPKKCKVCKEVYQPFQPLSMICSPKCASKYATQLREKKEKKEGVDRRRVIKKMKDKIKTLSDHKKELQVLVNRYVNLRDIKLSCISCNKPPTGEKRDAGHFWSQGGNPSTRFDLANIHTQCVRCNRDLHGNLLDYRPRLIEKIGRKAFDDLATRRTQRRVFTIDEIENLKRLFKEKIKLIR